MIKSTIVERGECFSIWKCLLCKLGFCRPWEQEEDSGHQNNSVGIPISWGKFSSKDHCSKKKDRTGHRQATWARGSAEYRDRPLGGNGEINKMVPVRPSSPHASHSLTPRSVNSDCVLDNAAEITLQCWACVSRGPGWVTGYLRNRSVWASALQALAAAALGLLPHWGCAGVASWCHVRLCYGHAAVAATAVTSPRRQAVTAAMPARREEMCLHFLRPLSPFPALAHALPTLGSANSAKYGRHEPDQQYSWE